MLQQISLFRKVQCPIQIRGFFSGKKKQRKKKKGHKLRRRIGRGIEYCPGNTYVLYCFGAKIFMLMAIFPK